MHANPSTAQPCALDNSSPKARLIQKINDAPANTLLCINAILDAIALHDTAPLHALIKACPRNKSVKDAARTMIAMIEKNLASKGVQE